MLLKSCLTCLFHFFFLTHKPEQTNFNCAHSHHKAVREEGAEGKTVEGKSICRAVGIELCKQLWLVVLNTKGKNGHVFNKMKAIP